MQRTVLKNQIVLFGQFSFPPVADTTIKLISAFATLGFLPQVLNATDPNTGMSTPRISLIRGSEQIMFAPDRIDIMSVMPSNDSLVLFVADVVEYASRLEGGSLKFTRLGVVQDYVLQELDARAIAQFRIRLLPSSPEGSNEWTARWVQPVVIDQNGYNLCFEALMAPGLAMAVNNKVTPVNGVKIMHDLSTSPQNLASRFDKTNLKDSLEAMVAIIEHEKERTIS